MIVFNSYINLIIFLIDLLIQLELLNENNFKEQQTLPKDMENLQKKKPLMVENSSERNANREFDNEELSLTTNVQTRFYDDPNLNSVVQQNHQGESKTNSFVDLMETEQTQLNKLVTRSFEPGMLKY